MIETLSPRSLSIAIATSSDWHGGAARAALRLHQSLTRAGISSRMLVDSAAGDEPGVEPASELARLWSRAGSRAEDWLLQILRSGASDPRSLGLVPGSAGRRLRRSGVDVINVHWPHAGYLSIRQLSRVKSPLVWTLHDMWAFCGSEHFALSDKEARWRTGYRRDSRPSTQGGLDLDAWTWRRKVRSWKRPMHLVTPSSWLADCTRQSPIMADWPVRVIPNPLPIDVFRPVPRKVAREALGLPANVPIILFGAIAGTIDARKGFDLFLSALPRIVELLPDAQALVFGASAPPNPERVPLPTLWLGHLNDELTLNLAYSAGDVMMVPSRTENLPQTATEAQAAGTPVVAFRTTGLVDAISDRQTGYLAHAFDPGDLANGVEWVLRPENHRRLGIQARERATRLWAPPTIARQYAETYAEAVADYRPN
jgi:glycosyltransferase involved in cell wall biosynthesis